MNLVSRLGSRLTIDDFYAGAGGETTGAKKAGFEVRHAFNHWDKAIESHHANHPETEAILADIGTYDPHSYEPSIMAWFSPECKTHSLARGKSQKPLRQTPLPGFGFEVYDLTPQEERSRVTAGDILRHVEVHRYEAIVVENVVQFRLWERFDDWLQTLINFGYEWEIVYLNSMFCHPTPQSRDRMYVCLWRKGNRRPNLDIHPQAYCEHCGRDVDAVQTRKPTSSVSYMKYNEQYTYNCPACASVVEPYYYAAANIIDWGNLGQRIGDRKKPLAANTMKRIEKGLRRFVSDPPGPRRAALYGDGVRGGMFLTPYHQDEADRSRALDEPVMTVDGSPRVGLVTLASVNYFRPDRQPEDPAPTQTTAANYGAVFAPLIYRAYRTAALHTADQPVSTVVASGTHHWLLNTFIDNYYGQGGYDTPVEPLPTQSSHPHHSLVSPQTPDVKDCYFRMLTVDEIKQAMGFSKNYVLLGIQAEQVELAGQAVTPDAARVLLERMAESLGA